jgi:hypothetical protein
VKLSNGQDKQIDSLNIGDEILTIDQSKLISTPIIMMLDKHISKKGIFIRKFSNSNNFILALFYILKTSCGNQISLTEYHLIPKISYQGNLNYTIAKQIQIGDLLVGLFNNQLKSCRVINITNQIKKGYYAPLTMEGTLLVNQILASSFAHVNNHHIAQFYMFPFRYYYKLTRFISLNDPLYLYKTEGLNWLIKIMFHFARYFRLDTLILS